VNKCGEDFKSFSSDVKENFEIASVLDAIFDAFFVNFGLCWRGCERKIEIFEGNGEGEVD
jgi:hypothetical protein